MKTLAAVLSPYADDTPEFGGAPPLLTDTLPRDLAAVSRRAERVFLVLVAMLIALFLGCLALVVVSFNSPARLSAILAATGVSIPWIIKTMMDLWKQKVASDMLITLVGTLEPGVAKSVVSVAASHLYGTSVRAARASAPRVSRRAPGP